MKPFDRLNDDEMKNVLESQLNTKLNPNEIITLERIHYVWKKWFHIESTNRIDIVLAVALSQKEIGIPLWLILIAPSGDMKSEQIKALDDDNLNTKWVHKLTDKTLVNGFPESKKEMYPDLAPKLNNKLMLIEDMAEILQLRTEIKTEVWAQLRTLYDGRAGAMTGMGADILYKNLYVTFIGASTPAIDEQILIHQSLGSRELLYRPKEIINIDMLMARAWYNEDFDDIIRPEIKAVTQQYLKGLTIKTISIPKEIEDKIKGLALYLSKLRAPAPIDGYSGDLRNNVTPEQPTRVLKQLKRLFVCLKSLDDNYEDDKALHIIKEVVESSIISNRKRVLDVLMSEDKEFTTSEVADRLRIGKKTAKTELNILWNMDIISYSATENVTPWGETKVLSDNWKINSRNKIVNFIRNNFL